MGSEASPNHGERFPEIEHLQVVWTSTREALLAGAGRVIGPRSSFATEFASAHEQRGQRHPSWRHTGVGPNDGEGDDDSGEVKEDRGKSASRLATSAEVQLSVDDEDEAETDAGIDISRDGAAELAEARHDDGDDNA
eukprot:CAMPEP_0115315744 /NCGR_PEP_ID=MMETSP0270-20121206/77748_1 /TAXON_ID=71861 /ORGANISM="Scrippsiella trochoidea, Strain CCMP3099" /LENGTH=136 /DNA_ID=CAMNT_0002735095 /DNA_START=851 /DNA_END=1261 /DNA_ORIENTATION=-